MRILCLALLILLPVAGCDTTAIRFKEPAGTVMTLKGQSYTWPATVTLERPGAEGGDHVEPLRMTIPAEDGKTLNVRGEIHTYAYFPMDVDKYAANECSIGKEHLQKLRDGFAVTIDGYSAGSRARIYRILLGREE